MSATSYNKVQARYLPSQQLADRWMISIQTLYNWIAAGRDLPPSLKIGGKRRWALEDVEKWENARKEETKVVI